jgi:hypothetical protein
MRHRRNDRVYAQLYKAEGEAVGSGAVERSHYAHEQRDLCVRDLDDRATEMWAAYRRVVIDAGVRWSETLREEILGKIGADLQQDVNYVQEIARSVIAGHGHSFELFLADACKVTMSRLSTELTLFGMTHRPLLQSIATEFRSPRYDGPRGQWDRVIALLRAEKPDLFAAAKEAVGAVEGLARILIGSETSTLGESIKKLRTAGHLHSSTARALEAFWAMANTVPGLRHGSHTPESIADVEVQYLIDNAEAAIQLLVRLDRAQVAKSG